MEHKCVSPIYVPKLDGSPGAYCVFCGQEFELVDSGKPGPRFKKSELNRMNTLLTAAYMNIEQVWHTLFPEYASGSSSLINMYNFSHDKLTELGRDYEK